MTQRDIFYKWLFYALVGVLWAVIQQLVLNRLDFWGGVHPFVLPLVPVMVAILENLALVLEKGKRMFIK